jgi:hypothetical protein
MRKFIYPVIAVLLSSLGFIGGQAAQAQTPVAAYTGAYAKNAPTWPVADQKIGPLQSDKYFYDTLPTSYDDPTWGGAPGCGTSTYPSNILCIITYDIPTTNLASFIKSMNGTHHEIILVFVNEPEGPGKFPSGQAYVKEFEGQSNLIREYVKEYLSSATRPEIQIAEDSTYYQYDPGTKHDNGGSVSSPGGCPYIVPTQYLNYYLIDIYRHMSSAASLGQNVEWNTWAACTKNGNGVDRGIAEYGVNCGNNNSSVLTDTLIDDNTYLKENFPGLEVWNLWYYGGCVFGNKYGAITEWKTIEAGN